MGGMKEREKKCVKERGEGNDDEKKRDTETRKQGVNDKKQDNNKCTDGNERKSSRIYTKQ